MISLPLSPFVTDPAEVFRDTARLPIPISDRLWRYDRANLRYLEYWDLFPSQFGLCQRGEGYWLYLDQPATVLYPGLAPGSFEVSLPTHGWYLIGGASADTQVADLRVRDGQGAVHTWPEAIGALVSDPLYGWSSAGLCYETVGSDVLDDLHALQAWQGYWLYTFQDNLTLILP